MIAEAVTPQGLFLPSICSQPVLMNKYQPWSRYPGREAEDTRRKLAATVEKTLQLHQTIEYSGLFVVISVQCNVMTWPSFSAKVVKSFFWSQIIQFVPVHLKSSN